MSTTRPFHSENPAGQDDRYDQKAPSVPREPAPSKLDALDDLPPDTQFLLCESKQGLDLYASIGSVTGHWSLISLDGGETFIDGWRQVDGPICDAPAEISSDQARQVARTVAEASGARLEASDALHDFNDAFNKPFVQQATAPTSSGGPFASPFQSAFLDTENAMTAAVSVEDMREAFDLDTAPPPSPERSQRIVRDAWRAAVGDDSPELQPLVEPKDAQRVVSEAQGVDIDALRELLREIEALLDKAGPSEIEQNASSYSSQSAAPARRGVRHPCRVRRHHGRSQGRGRHLSPNRWKQGHRHDWPHPAARAVRSPLHSQPGHRCSLARRARSRRGRPPARRPARLTWRHLTPAQAAWPASTGAPGTPPPAQRRSGSPCCAQRASCAPARSQTAPSSFTSRRTATAARPPSSTPYGGPSRCPPAPSAAPALTPERTCSPCAPTTSRARASTSRSGRCGSARTTRKGSSSTWWTQPSPMPSRPLSVGLSWLRADHARPLLARRHRGRRPSR